MDNEKMIKFKSRIKEKVGDEYTCLSETFINNKTHVSMRHNCPDCGYNTWEVRPDNFLQKNNPRRCPVCAVKKRAKKRTTPTEKFLKKLTDQVGDEYTCLSEFKNVDSYVTMRHNCPDCNYHTWEITPNMFLGKKQRRCPVCNKHDNLTSERFQERLDLKYGKNVYTLEQEFTNVNDILRFKHQKCNQPFEICATNILYKEVFNCPICEKNQSHGEKLVEEVLNELELEYEKQATFETLRTKKTFYKFDFKVFVNEIDYFLIEYDGVQHFEKVKFFEENGHSSFERVKNRDTIKNNFCLENSIPLLRIPYTLTKQEILNQIKNFIEFND